MKKQRARKEHGGLFDETSKCGPMGNDTTETIAPMTRSLLKTVPPFYSAGFPYPGGLGTASHVRFPGRPPADPGRRGASSRAMAASRDTGATCVSLFAHLGHSTTLELQLNWEGSKCAL